VGWALEGSSPEVPSITSTLTTITLPLRSQAAVWEAPSLPDSPLLLLWFLWFFFFPSNYFPITSGSLYLHWIRKLLIRQFFPDVFIPQGTQFLENTTPTSILIFLITLSLLTWPGKWRTWCNIVTKNSAMFAKLRQSFINNWLVQNRTIRQKNIDRIRQNIHQIYFYEDSSIREAQHGGGQFVTLQRLPKHTANLW